MDAAGLFQPANIEDRIIRGGTLALGLLLPVVYWPDAATAKDAVILGLGSILGCGLVWRATRSQSGHSCGGLGVAWMTFLAIAALSVVGAAKPYQGLKALFPLGLACLICLAAAVAWPTHASLRLLSATLWIGGATAALLALWGGRNYTDVQVGVVPFGNTNYAGAYFATVAPLALGTALGTRGARRWLSSSAFCLLTVTLFLTRARAGWMAFLAAMTGMAVCRVATRGVDRKRVGLAVLAAGILIFLSDVLLRLTGTSLGRIVATILDPAHPTNHARLIWWGDTFRMISDAPLLGVGLGNFQYVYPRYASLNRLPFMQLNPYLEHPHNEYLGLAAEVGLLGLAAMAGVLLAGALAARHALRVQDDTTPETVGLVGAVTAGAVNAAFFYTWHSPAGVAFWMILGLLWATGQQRSNAPSAPTSSPSGIAAPLHPRTSNLVIGHWPLVRQPARLALAAVGIGGIVAFGFVFGVRPLVSSYLADRARADWYRLRGKEAVEGFRQAFAWEADNYLVPFEAGMGFFRASLFPQAMEAFAEVTRLHPTHLAARNNLGLTLVRLRDIPRAKARYREALAINPEYAVARNNLANILLSEKDLPGAIREYRRALQSHPGYAEAWYNLAIALEEAGQDAEAARTFRRAAEIEPTMTDAARQAEQLEVRLAQSGRGEGASP